MPKEIITSKQAICIIIMFLFGSSVVMGVNSDFCQDTWIALLCSMVIVIPIILVYARIMKLYPGKDIFDIIEHLFGRLWGNMIIILIILYALHLGSMVLRNFSEFIKVVSMDKTPELVLMIGMTIITSYLAKSGIEVVARWSVVIFPITLGVVFITIVLSLNNMNFNNILPFMDHSLADLSKTAYSIFSFPFAETVLFLAIANSIKKTDSPYKIYLYAIIWGLILFLIIILRNLFILGAPMIRSVYFPSYTAARLINVGDFLTRIEGSITINFILAGITKITVCLLAASKGIAHIFKVNDYHNIVVPTNLIILAICSIVYNNITQMFEFIQVYSIYTIPFQIVIPLLIWITAEIKKKSPPLQSV